VRCYRKPKKLLVDGESSRQRVGKKKSQKEKKKIREYEE